MDPSKTFVFQDFTDTGNTLARFEEFIKSPEMDLDKNNLKFDSINEVLAKFFNKETPREDLMKIMHFKTSLANQTSIYSIKTYTNIKKLTVDNLKNIVIGIVDANVSVREDFDYALKKYLKPLH